MVRSLAFLFLFLSTLTITAPRAHAQYWGTDNIFSDIMMNVIETAQRQMEGAVLATLKMAAVQLVNNQVGQAIGGSALGQALFITNFNDFLYQAPAQKTELYMNDFFTLTTRGKASQANYVGVGDTTAIGDSYATYLKTLAEQATTKKPAAFQTNLEEYTANPATMFAEGDFRAFNAFFSNPANNPFGYSLQAEQVYQKKLAEEQNAATIKATSSGFLPGETKSGSVTAPAGSIEALQTNAQNLPNLVLANAQNPGELASGIVSAMANKVITNLIQKGVGEVQTSIQREINGVNGEVNGTVAKLRQAVGPGVEFLNTATQRLDIKVKPAQPPVISSGTRTSFTAGSDVDAIPYYPGGSNDPDGETSGGGRSGGDEDVDPGIGGGSGGAGTVPENCRVADVTWSSGLDVRAGSATLTPKQRLLPGQMVAFRKTVPETTSNFSGTEYDQLSNKVMSISTNPCDFSSPELATNSCQTTSHGGGIMLRTVDNGVSAPGYCQLPPAGSVVYYNLKIDESQFNFPDNVCPAGYGSCEFYFYH